MELQHYQAAFLPLLFGVGIAIVLCSVFERNRPGSPSVRQKPEIRSRKCSQQLERENTNDFWRGAKAWRRFQLQWPIRVKRRLWQGQSRPRATD